MEKNLLKKSLVVGVICLLMLVPIPTITGDIEFQNENSPLDRNVRARVLFNCDINISGKGRIFQFRNVLIWYVQGAVFIDGKYRSFYAGIPAVGVFISFVGDFSSGDSAYITGHAKIGLQYPNPPLPGP